MFVFILILFKVSDQYYLIQAMFYTFLYWLVYLKLIKKKIFISNILYKYVPINSGQKKHVRLWMQITHFDSLPHSHYCHHLDNLLLD
jgi:hypothetical protein